MVGLVPTGANSAQGEELPQAGRTVDANRLALIGEPTFRIAGEVFGNFRKRLAREQAGVRFGVDAQARFQIGHRVDAAGAGREGIHTLNRRHVVLLFDQRLNRVGESPIRVAELGL